MLTIDLKSLKLQELLRLLESARTRGEDELARVVSAELASRQGRRATPHDPSPLSVRAAPEPAAAIARESWSLGRTAALAAGVAALGLATVWAFNLPQPAPPPTAAAAVAAAPSLQAVAPAPAIPAAPRAAVLLTSLPDRAAVRSAAARPAVHSPTAGNPCLTLSKPGDRLVCGYPALAARQRRLEAALERARAAGEDTEALEAAQAAWMKGRDRTWDRHRLADLYDARIGELEGAAASAGGDPPS